MDRIIVLNTEKDWAGVYSAHPRNQGRYQTPLLFDGTLAQCLEWRHYVVAPRTPENKWRFTLINAVSKAASYGTEDGEEVEEVLGIQLRNREDIEERQATLQEQEEFIERIKARKIDDNF